jgi:serine/threonine protein kinase, bacterial
MNSNFPSDPAAVPCAYCGGPIQPSDSSCKTCGAPIVPSPFSPSSQPVGDFLPSGTLLRGGQYRLEQGLGQGGFGLTYRAWDTGMQAPVAIKELFPSGLVRRTAQEVTLTPALSVQDYQKLRDNAWKEARLLFDLRDQAIVRGLAVWEENNTVYTAMEFLEGETLAQRLVRAPLTEMEALELVEKLLVALDKLHAINLLHRDLKPENIILTPQYGPVLIDFGTALTYDTGKTLNLTSRLLTPHYAPLEQYGSQVRLTPATDLYALAATLYHALSGMAPPTAVDRSSGIPMLELNALRTLKKLPVLSTPFVAALESALELRMDQRPQSVADWLERLNPPVWDLSSVTPPSSVPNLPIAPKFPTALPKVPIIRPDPDEFKLPPKEYRPPLFEPEVTTVPWWIYLLLLVIGGFVLSSLLSTFFVSISSRSSNYYATPDPTPQSIPTPAPIPTPTPVPTPIIPVTTNQNTNQEELEVLANKLNMRTAPDAKAPLITGEILNRGDRLPILQKQAGWWKIQSYAYVGKIGWVSSRLVAPTKSTVDAAELQRVESALERGGTVQLLEGVYKLNHTFSLTDNLEIVGAGRDQSYLIFDQAGSVLEYSGEGHLHLANLTIARVGGFAGAVIRADSGAITLENVRVMGGLDQTPANSSDSDEGDGLSLYGEAQATIANSEFLANQWRGIHLQDQATATVQNSHLEFNSGSGAALHDTSKLSLDNSSSSSNGLSGLKASGTATLEVENSTLNNNREGVYLADQAKASLTGVICQRNHVGNFYLEAKTTLEGASPKCP